MKLWHDLTFKNIAPCIYWKPIPSYYCIWKSNGNRINLCGWHLNCSFSELVGSNQNPFLISPFKKVKKKMLHVTKLTLLLVSPGFVYIWLNFHLDKAFVQVEWVILRNEWYSDRHPKTQGRKHEDILVLCIFQTCGSMRIPWSGGAPMLRLH